MSDPEPQLDLKKLAFPSDRLTIKDLRKLEPKFFDSNHDRLHHYPDWQLMLAFERNFAEGAFKDALGTLSQDQRYGQMETWKEDLPGYYVRFGLASGPHHSEQMIRDIESQARAQARSHVAPPLS